MPQRFEDFLEKRRDAALSYVKGDASPVAELSAKSGAATFFDPSGGIVEGADAVLRAYGEGAQMFGPQSVTEIDILDQGSSGDIGFWTGIQRATVAIRSRAEPVAMTLRISEVFRRHDGDWRMVHRHASMAKDAGKPS